MLITTILLLCLGQVSLAAQPPATTPPPEMTDTQRETIARALLADLVAGRYEDASRNFDAAMRSGLPPANLASELSVMMHREAPAFGQPSLSWTGTRRFTARLRDFAATDIADCAAVAYYSGDQ